MNERIKLLAEQATTYIEPTTTSGEGWIFDKDKFAELIVRECINCTKEWRDAVRVESDRDYSRGYVHGCDDAIVEMKTRFGVSE
jgi:hypothetical protein